MDYAAQMAEKMAALKADPDNGEKTDGKIEAMALEALGLKKTNTAWVIAMNEWIAGAGTKGDPDYRAPHAKGDYWGTN